MTTFSPGYSQVHSAVAVASTFSSGAGKIFTSSTIDSTFSPGAAALIDENDTTSTMSPAYSDTTTVNLPDFVVPLKRRSNRAYTQQVEATDALIVASVIRETAGQADLYGKIDTFTNAVEFATASTITDITIGGAASTVLLSSDVCITPNFDLAEDLIILKKDQLAAAEAAYAVERGTTGADSLLLWSETNTRFELGFTDTAGGTNIPTALTSFADLKINSLFLDSTAITADGNLTIASSASTDLSFNARSATTPLNDASNTSIDSSITETSLIGILNSLRTGGIVQLENYSDSYTNGEGFAITEGQLVRISANDTVRLSVATANNDTADYIGVVDDSSISAAASGSINTAGVANVRFESGLAVAPGNEVFMSISVLGSATTTRPTTSGNIVQSIGIVKDASAYDGATNLLAEVHLIRGSKAEVG